MQRQHWDAILATAILSEILAVGYLVYGSLQRGMTYGATDGGGTLLMAIAVLGLVIGFLLIRRIGNDIEDN